MPVFPSFLERFVVGASMLAIAGCGGSSPETYVARGDKFFDSGKFDDAAIQYQKALQKSPRLGDAHYRLGLVDLKNNQIMPAYREFLAATQFSPSNREATAKLGDVSLAVYNTSSTHPQQFYDQAVKAAAQLLDGHPLDFEGNMLKGALSLVESKPSDAVACLRKAVEAKPDSLDAKLGLARAVAAAGDAPESLQLARQAIQKDKTYSPAYDFLYEQYRASGNTEEGANILKLKVVNNPKQAAAILELARHFATVQKPAEADAAIRQLTGHPADFPDAGLIAGDYYQSVGRPDDALKEYETGLNATPKRQEIYRKRMIRILASQRKWAAASEQIQIVLKSKPEDSEAKLAQALIWVDEGKPELLDPAIAEFRSQLGKRPEDAALRVQLGAALARKGDQNGARREWLSAAKQDPNSVPPRLSLVELDLAQDKPQEGLDLVQETLALAPNDPQVRILYITCLTQTGKFRQARNELSRLEARFPASPQLQYRQGALALAEQRYKEAEDIFRGMAGPAAHEPQVITGLAQAYAGENQLDKAVQLLQEELKAAPDSSMLREVLARFAAGAGKYDIAIAQYKELIAAQPKAAQMQLSLAAAYTAKGDGASAIAILKRMVEADPKSPQALLEIAQGYGTAGQVNEAKACYRRLLAIQPGNPNALNDLAYLMADGGENLDEALTLAKRGQQAATDPGLKASISDTLGWIYLKKNMSDNALQLFQPLVKSNPANSTFRYHLGAALYQKGEKVKARAELQAALAGKPDSQDTPKIRELLARL